MSSFKTQRNYALFAVLILGGIIDPGKEILELDAQVMAFLLENGRPGYMNNVLRGSYRAALHKLQTDPHENKNKDTTKPNIVISNFFTLDTDSGKVTMQCDDGTTKDVTKMLT